MRENTRVGELINAAIARAENGGTVADVHETMLPILIVGQISIADQLQNYPNDERVRELGKQCLIGMKLIVEAFSPDFFRNPENMAKLERAAKMLDADRALVANARRQGEI